MNQQVKELTTKVDIIIMPIQFPVYMLGIDLL